MADTTEAKISYNQDLGVLSAVEKRAVMLMRALVPYQKIEIRLTDNKPGKISIISTGTLREDFPANMV